MNSNAELVPLYEKHFANLPPLPTTVRCHTIPFIRNPGFFGRKDILDTIDKSFREQPIRPTSIALWGAAGIGKTQIALEYANRLWSEGFDVIIWISSETSAERAKSYSDAARQLQFKEFSETDTLEKNQHLLSQWLQRTDVPWLLVFDNVESQADLQTYWPTAGQGRILVTCRSEILAGTGLIARSLEVPPFTVSESTEMILQITEQCEAPETEVEAAREVSGELGGLALAIDITAKHIKNSRRFRSVQEFIPAKNAKDELLDASLIRVNPETGLMYMIEIQHFLDAERSLLSLLETTKNDSVLAAKLHRSLLGLYERTGRSILAKSSASSELPIVLKYFPSASNNVANALSNMGYTRVSAFEASDGVPYLDRAISIAKDVPEPGRYEQFNIDRFLRNRGRANAQMGRFEDALRDFDDAEDYQKMIHGSKSHYDGETYYERAKIEAWRGNLGKAYSLATRAHDLVSAGKPTHASVMAAQYRLGWIAMLQGGNDLALQHFEKSLVISRMNEQHRGNSGESARIQWRMSQVLERMGREEDALRLREAAVKVKASLLATGDYAQAEDEESSWDALVGLLYR
ncbi:P-loop containing nucleoside triphosphate hydrolase protein [Trichoderma sp. SZMC 28013]